MIQAKSELSLNIKPLDPEEVSNIDACWRACNYLAAGMIYLLDNHLLRQPLKLEHVRNRLLGHRGASPGLASCMCI